MQAPRTMTIFIDDCGVEKEKKQNLNIVGK
jgi:hypothetical protein